MSLAIRHVPLPVNRAEVDVVVGVYLHQQTSTDVAVETTDSKVRIVRHVLYSMGILREGA